MRRSDVISKASRKAIAAASGHLTSHCPIGRETARDVPEEEFRQQYRSREQLLIATGKVCASLEEWRKIAGPLLHGPEWRG